MHTRTQSTNSKKNVSDDESLCTYVQEQMLMKNQRSSEKTAQKKKEMWIKKKRKEKTRI